MAFSDPVSEPDALNPERAAAVREHLKEVIANPAFAGSKRAQDFLQLIVEHALAGRYDNLRERMIGAEMFGRPVGYDTANDAVVRVKATEVRKKLAQYYLGLETKPAVRIEIPAGSYVPKFHWKTVETPAEGIRLRPRRMPTFRSKCSQGNPSGARSFFPWPMDGACRCARPFGCSWLLQLQGIFQSLRLRW